MNDARASKSGGEHACARSSGEVRESCCHFVVFFQSHITPSRFRLTRTITPAVAARVSEARPDERATEGEGDRGATRARAS